MTKAGEFLGEFGKENYWGGEQSQPGEYPYVEYEWHGGEMPQLGEGGEGWADTTSVAPEYTGEQEQSSAPPPVTPTTPPSTTPGAPPAGPGPVGPPTTDQSKWDTDGYATPSYTAQKFGSAPAGWDATKWANPNHQTPKYVVGRILSSAGDLKNPASRDSAIKQIQQAYPGAQFNGKDKISIDGGKSWVDIFGGASAGVYSPAWMPDEAGGGGGSSSSTPYTSTPYRPTTAGMTIAGGPSTPSYIPPSTPPAGGAPTPTPKPAPNRTNFSWGVHGQGVEGKDYGNTNNWTEEQWQAFEGTGGQGWGSGGPSTAGGPVTAAPPATPGLPAAPTTGGTEPGPAAPNPKKELMDLLMKRMKQSTEISPDDAAVRKQTTAYRAEQERAKRNYLADMAEGTNRYSTGAMRGEERMAAEKLGSNVSSFQSELMSRELTSRRAEIQSAIDGMGAMLTEGERQALQRELAQLDAAIKRQQMDMQNSQFTSQLSQADRHFAAQLAQQGRFAELDDLFRNKQLSQQDQQWRDRMGFDTQQQRNEWEWKQRGNK